MRDIDRYYKILDLEPGASPEELKQAYRGLVKVWHPDRFPDDLQLQQKAQDKLKEINEAYERLQSVRPRPRPKAPQSASRSRRQRRNERRSPGSQARRVGHGGWLLLVLAFGLLWTLEALESMPQEIRNPILSLAGAIQHANRGYFTVGSTRDEVLAVQGTPTRMIISHNSSTLYYGLSRVHFASGRVVSWDISPKNPLKVKKVLRDSPSHN